MEITLDSRRFRAAMACLPTGVTVVACGTATEPAAMTANSVTSVSLEPPLLLVCVRNESRWLSPLQRHGYFSVNVLKAGHQAVSQHYAGRGNSACQAQWVVEHDVPVLDNAGAALVCEVVAQHAAGDHTIVIGQVVALRDSGPDSGAGALVYLRGQYHELGGVAT